ncbi:hypothetical protein [Streptomyces sp. CB09001]|uniref:hypothetical protein n=1 Tax=Streptomyces sp. CB09001 TaxID=2083284 RepID=UPI0013BE8B70|nr:hypothetical protein [Streptomyces sp. CB09001]
MTAVPEEQAGKRPEAREPLLDQCAVCGLCGEPCRYAHTAPGEPARYYCRSDCQPAVPAAELEARVGRAVMERLCTPAGLARMAAAEQLLRRLGHELPEPVPRSAAHAVRQWDLVLDEASRRSAVRESLLSVALSPSRDRPEAVRLFYAWRRPPVRLFDLE